MRKFRFCVIYIEDGKIKHKQISAYAAPCAIEDFKLLKPNAQVLEAGLGCVSKEYWKALKEKEAEIIAEVSKNEETKKA